MRGWRAVWWAGWWGIVDVGRSQQAEPEWDARENEGMYYDDEYGGFMFDPLHYFPMVVLRWPVAK